MVIRERSALPVILLTLLLGLLMQGMLAGLLFTTLSFEWIYRGLYVLALLLNLMVVHRVNPGSLVASGVVLSPMIMATFATWLVISDQFLASPLALLMLPLAHSVVCVFLLGLRGPPPGGID
jgi:hypothetical protein